MSNRLEALQDLARKLHRLYAWRRILNCIPARDESIESVKFRLELKGLFLQKGLGVRENLKQFWTRDLIRENSLKWIVGGLKESYFRHSLMRFGEKELRLFSLKVSDRLGIFKEKESGLAGVSNAFLGNSLMKVLREKEGGLISSRLRISDVTRQGILATSSEILRRSSSRVGKVFERVNSFGLLGGENVQVPKPDTEIFSSSTVSRIASMIKNSRVQRSIDNRKVIHIANLTIENAHISDLETFKMELNSIVGD